MSTKIETLDFNSNSDMVPLNNNPTAPMPETDKEPKQSTYESQRDNLAKNHPKNNIHKDQMMELSTPLNEVMDMPPQEQQQMMAPPQPTMMAPQAPTMPAQEQQVPRVKKNPGGLSDEQMDALLVAGAAAIAFSPQVKERMMQYVPNLFSENGARTIGGTVATGLVAAGVFYGVKKFVLKN